MSGIVVVNRTIRHRTISGLLVQALLSYHSSDFYLCTASSLCALNRIEARRLVVPVSNPEIGS